MVECFNCAEAGEPGAVMPVDRLAGRELDAAVAEEVMGLNPFTGRDGLLYGHLDSGGACDVPQYSTDIAAAWPVIEKLLTLYWYVDVGPSGPVEKPAWRCRLDRYQGEGEYEHADLPFTLWGDTAPEAICRAALTAVRASKQQEAKA